MFTADRYARVKQELRDDNRYRERPDCTMPYGVTFTNDGGRAVPAPVAFDARQRLGAWRLEA